MGVGGQEPEEVRRPLPGASKGRQPCPHSDSDLQTWGSKVLSF